jgi:hypothetical protein
LASNLNLAFRCVYMTYLSLAATLMLELASLKKEKSQNVEAWYHGIRYSLCLALPPFADSLCYVTWFFINPDCYLPACWHTEGWVMVDSQLNSFNWLNMLQIVQNAVIPSFQNWSPIRTIRCGFFPTTREPHVVPVFSQPWAQKIISWESKHMVLQGRSLFPTSSLVLIVRNPARMMNLRESHYRRCGLVGSWAMQVQFPFQHCCPTTLISRLWVAAFHDFFSRQPRLSLLAIGCKQKLRPEPSSVLRESVLPGPQYPFSKV